MSWDRYQFECYTFVGRYVRFHFDDRNWWRVEFRTYYRRGHKIEIVTDTLGLDGVEDYGDCN